MRGAWQTRWMPPPIISVGATTLPSPSARCWKTVSYTHLVALLEPEERARIKGLLINKFRGDVEILRPGLAMLEEKTQLPCLLYTSSACAGALGVQLAGPAYYFGEYYAKPTIGLSLIHISAGAAEEDAPQAERSGLQTAFAQTPAPVSYTHLVCLPGELRCWRIWAT